MAISYVSKYELYSQVNTIGPPTLTWPAGTTTDDLIIGVHALRSCTADTAAAGWTHLFTETNANFFGAGEAGVIKTYWRRYTASGPGSWTKTGLSHLFAMATFRGMGDLKATPYDSQTGTGVTQNYSPVQPAAPSILFLVDMLYASPDAPSFVQVSPSMSAIEDWTPVHDWRFGSWYKLYQTGAATETPSITSSAESPYVGGVIALNETIPVREQPAGRRRRYRKVIIDDVVYEVTAAQLRDLLATRFARHVEAEMDAQPPESVLAAPEPAQEVERPTQWPFPRRAEVERKVASEFKATFAHDPWIAQALARMLAEHRYRQEREEDDIEALTWMA